MHFCSSERERERWGGGLGGKEEVEMVRNGSMHMWEGKSAGPSGRLKTGLVLARPLPCMDMNSKKKEPSLK